MKNTVKDMENKINEIDDALSSNHDATLFEKRKNVKSELDALLLKEATGAQIRARAQQWRNLRQLSDIR